MIAPRLHFIIVPEETAPTRAPEPDPRFPSGEWVGFFLQRELFAGRVRMEIHLTFSEGVLEGEGRDVVGDFTLRGTYDTDSGDVSMHKQYTGAHSVHYRGCNEGRGIWGVWEIAAMRGGFHIWPKEMPDPTRPRLKEAIEEPAPAEGVVEETAV